jgi:ZIP family zinc transporter
MEFFFYTPAHILMIWDGGNGMGNEHLFLNAAIVPRSLFGIALAGLITGITGTGLGGLTAFFPSTLSKRFQSTLLEFTTGIMISMVCMELLPEGYKTGGFIYVTIGIILGVLMIIIVDAWLKLYMKKEKKNPAMLSGWMMVFAVALHNLPEGFAVGAGFQSSAGTGMTLSLAILLHDIPEGMAMAIPLRVGKIKPLKVFLITILSGIPMGVGAFFGAAFGGISEIFSAICLGTAGGAMMYVSLGDLINQSRSLYRGRLPLVGNMAGILTGALISLLG